jgi:hypothetical protein
MELGPKFEYKRLSEMFSAEMDFCEIDPRWGFSVNRKILEMKTTKKDSARASLVHSGSFTATGIQETITGWVQLMPCSCTIFQTASLLHSANNLEPILRLLNLQLQRRRSSRLESF